MQNSNQVLRNIFDNLYFHVKSYVKRKENENQVQYFIKKIRPCRFKNWKLGVNLISYTFMQNLRQLILSLPPEARNGFNS